MAALTVQNLPDGCAPRRWSVKSLPSRLRLRLSRARRRSLAQIQAAPKRYLSSVTVANLWSDMAALPPG